MVILPVRNWKETMISSGESQRREKRISGNTPMSKSPTAEMKRPVQANLF